MTSQSNEMEMSEHTSAEQSPPKPPPLYKRSSESQLQTKSLKRVRMQSEADLSFVPPNSPQSPLKRSHSESVNPLFLQGYQDFLPRELNPLSRQIKRARKTQKELEWVTVQMDQHFLLDDYKSPWIRNLIAHPQVHSRPSSPQMPDQIVQSWQPPL